MRPRVKSVSFVLTQFSVGIATLLLSLSPSLLPSPSSLKLRFQLPASAQTPTTQSRKAEAERLLEQGDRQLSSFDDERNKAALQAFQKALEIARILPDRTLEGKALSSIGEAYLFLGDSDRAIEYARQSLAIARELPNRELEGASLSILGAADIGKDAAKSLAYQQQALTIVRELSNRPLEVKVLRRLGHTYRQQKDYPQAIDAYQQSLEVARAIRDRDSEKSALNQLSNAYQSLQQYPKAIEMTQQLLGIAREESDRPTEINQLTNLGDIYHSNLNDNPKAIEYYQQALQIAETIKRQDLQIDGLLNIARSTYQIAKTPSDYQNAIALAQQGLNLAQEIKDASRQARASAILATGYRELKDYPKTIAAYEQSLAMAREAKDSNREAAILSLLAGLYKEQLNDHRKAIEYYRQILPVAEKLNNRELQTDALLDIAYSSWQIAKSPSDYQKNIELAQHGLKLAQDIKDVARQARALAILANTYGYLKDYPQAITAYEQSIAAAREAKESNREAALLNSLGNLYKDQLNDYCKAIEYYQQALQVAEKHNDQGANADALLNIAASSQQLAKAPSDYRPVIELAQRGLKLAQAIKDASRQARALAILANTYGYLKDYPQAITAYEQSIAAAREAKESNREAALLNGLGNLYNDQLNDYRKAIEYYQQALQVAEKLNDRESQVNALLNIANSSRQIATSPSDYQNVIELTQQALKLAQNTNNRPSEARALALLGDTYKGLQEYTKAIAYYQQSIATAREAKDEQRAAKVLSALGALYHESLNNSPISALGALYHESLNNSRKGLEYYQQGLQVAEKLQNPALQIEALLNIANSSRQLITSPSDYQKIIELAQRGLKLAQDTQNRAGEARALVILGLTYNSMKDYPKAIELLQQSLAIAKDTKDEYRESDTLTALSNTYSSLRDYPKAINYAQQALSAAQKNKNSQLEAIALINLVGTHYDLGAYSEALTYTQQLKALGQQSKNKLVESLASSFLTALYYVQGDAQVTQAAQQNMLLAREIQNPFFEGMAIWIQGWLYADAKDYTKALSAVQETLKIAQKTKNQYLENLSQGLLGQIYHKQGQTEQAIAAYRASLALNNDIFSADVGLARVYRDINMPVTAITYYKQAISKTEKIRTNIRELSTDFQKSFLGAIIDIDRTKNADIYRELADVLISQGRITEAQQALELLKVQELNDFSNRVRAGDQLPSVELNDTEQKIKEKHGTLITFGKRLDECEQTQCSTLEEFQAQLNQLNQDFTQQIQRIEQETQDNRVTQVSQGTEDFIASADKIVSAQPNTVLIYPLVLADKVRLLWASKGGVLDSQVCPMGKAQLWKTISEFRDLLKTPNSDITQVKATGKTLYDCLVKPLEPELQKNNIQNLVFVPDRATNYIPMGALFDGEKFLIERYTVSSVLNAGLTDVSDRLPPNPQNTPVLALGLSDAKQGFNALPNVPLELDTIVKQQTNDSRGIYPGAEFLNQSFTLEALQNNLRDRKILHIATHGAFVPQNPKESYLLLGNGDKYPIYQIQFLRNLRDIHLVVLSACETALGGPDANGTEIQGISSYFLRDKAKAVMASLWLVNDGSTSLLMQQFYKNLSTDKQPITKAEALRQAQLSLLTKQVSAKDAPQRSDAYITLDPTPGAQLPRSRTSDFSHPYYWAPFILIGNSL